MRVFRAELWRATRDRAFTGGLFLLLVCAILAISYGSRQIERQNRVIGKLENLVRVGDEAYFEERFKDDENIGRAHYYLSQAAAHKPLPEAALSLGQRDLHSFHQSYRLRSLYGNLFDAGFENPRRSEAGHFDLAFVLVFLLPLMIIATSYDLLSRESEGRTLPMVRASGIPLKSWLLCRFGARFSLTSALVTAVLALSLLLVGAKVTGLFSWGAVALLYITFWYAVCACVVGQAWGSAKSAGALLGVWTMLTVVAPALLALASPREATQQGSVIAIECRQNVNQGWDIEKSKTRTLAAQKDPRYLEAPILGEKFTWSWYYAMHDAADQSVEEAARVYFEGLRERDSQAYSRSVLIPPVRVQLLFDRLAATDLATHLEYYDFVKQSREGMRQDFLPRVFAEETLSKEQLLRLHEELPMLVFQARPASVSGGLWGLALISCLFTVLGLFSLGGVESRLRGAGSC